MWTRRTGRSVEAAAARSMASVEDPHGPFDDGQLRRRRDASSRSRSWRTFSSRKRSSRASGIGRGRDHDLAAVVGIGVALEQAQLDEPVGQLAGGRRADPETGGELGHAQSAGGHHDVQDLGLRHRDADLGELRGVAADEAVHHPLVAVEDPLDVGRGRCRCSCQVECSVTPYSSVGPHYIASSAASGSRTIGPVTPPHPAGPRDRAPVPRDPPPAGAAAVPAAANRPPSCASWSGSARSSSTRSRSPVATTTWCWPPGSTGYRRAWTDGAPVRHARAVRDLQQGPLDRPDRRAAVVSHRLGREPPRSRRSRVRRARPARGGAPGPDPAGRAAGLDRHRAAGRHRLVLAADQPDPGDPRGAGGGGHPRAGPARRQPARLRPRGAAVPGRAARQDRPAARDQRRHKLLSRYRAHGLLGRSGSGELWSGIGPARASPIARTGRVERSSWPSSSRTGPSSR